MSNNTIRNVIVLPGLDGTGLLLERFRDCAPAGIDVRLIALPDNPQDDYRTLCDFVSDKIQGLESCDLIAESFSGPIGILLAHRHPGVVRQLTLVASFATSPAPVFTRLIPWSIPVRFPIPSLFARRFLVGKDDSLIPELRHAIRQVSPKTIVGRVQSLLNVDVTKQLSELRCGLIYIRPTCDRLIPKRIIEAILVANPAMVVREIDGPHLVLQTSPELVWELIDGCKQ